MIRPRNKNRQFDERIYTPDSDKPEPRFVETREPFAPTTAELVREQSGKPYQLPSTLPGRFVLFAVSGWKIIPKSYSNNQGRSASKAWSVLDSEDQWTEVARFDRQSNHSGKTAYERAKEHAEQLNAKHKRESR